ncbi:diaminopimelate epimerase [candidate division WOR-1 bacterium RIFOXYC2_FULL_37_10]|uniref:Diaminopimelate epimerase n=1 Tax=candidate division WOR-1 bacterium RIFOXYB2_FULL_37_13 TaxID=1802579 RepID=A0A1F4SF71_UNCSA|nr:MAG: diaminopimelate epimerase [candidate division WOR-1 bacterium RIFOXYB2_FULL_37_13]OGC35032.1 MAG: diaminopimelate epimerase [candidate division WOR-1 bacterium RIFOXYC2_FULL_37_10]
MQDKVVNFVKMQGLGNDFVLIDGRKENLSGIELPQMTQDICDRHFGIGADGLIVVWQSEKADIRMQIFNPDGSEPEMCGNGIRCFAKYIYETSSDKKEVLSVETQAGIIIPAIIIKDGLVVAVEVDMGTPQDLGEISLQGYSFRKISMGNPHAVAFVDGFDDFDLGSIGSTIELDPHFSNRTNVEFVKVLNDHELEIRVWERGAGETLACGTGACAVVAAAVMAGKTGRRVLAHLPGGVLDIEWLLDDEHIVMRGPAEKVFEGKYFI